MKRQYICITIYGDNPKDTLDQLNAWQLAFDKLAAVDHIEFQDDGRTCNVKYHLKYDTGSLVLMNVAKR